MRKEHQRGVRGLCPGLEASKKKAEKKKKLKSIERKKKRVTTPRQKKIKWKRQ